MNLHNAPEKNTKSYFRYLLQHNWQHLMFYVILMLLAVVLPTVINVNEFNNAAYSTQTQKAARAEDIAVTISGALFVVSCVIAIFAGMSAFNYVNSKQAVGCFHSFPITRKSAYFTETATKAVYYLFSLLLTALFVYGVMEFNLPLTSQIRVVCLKMLVLSILSFCLFYSIALFAAGLSGTALLRFLMFGITALFPIAAYALVFSSVSIGMPDVNVNAYLDFDILKWLCPIPFIVDAMDAVLNKNASLFVHALLLLIPAVAFYSAGYFLHLKRKSEASGTSIIWKPVFLFIKYAIMFVGTLCGGAIFGTGLFSSSKGGLWYVFGAACGLVLSFILTNVILYRSIRSMFKGIRGLCGMALTVALVIAVSVYDVFGLNEYVYPSNATKSITINFCSTEIEYSDKDDLDFLLPALSDFLEWKNSPSYEATNVKIEWFNPVNDQTAADMEKYLSVYQDADKMEEERKEATAYDVSVAEKTYATAISPDFYQMLWKQNPKFGIPLYKDTVIPITERTRELIEFILASDEYAQSVRDDLSVTAESATDVSLNLFDFSFTFEYGTFKKDVVSRILEKYRFSNENRLNSPATGQIRVYGSERTFTVPIYAEDIETVNLLSEALGLDLNFTKTEEIYDYVANDIAAMFVVEIDTGNCLSVADEEKAEILSYLSLTGYKNYYGVAPDPAGTKYMVILVREELYNDGTSNLAAWDCMVRQNAEAAIDPLFP